MGHDEVQVVSRLAEWDQAAGMKQLVVRLGIGCLDPEDEVRVDPRTVPGGPACIR
jgi:hypothetical protein